MSQCVHEMDEGTCSWCTGKEPRRRSPVSGDHAGPTIEAQYGGICACCGERYRAGTTIRRSRELEDWAVLEHLKDES